MLDDYGKIHVVVKKRNTIFQENKFLKFASVSILFVFEFFCVLLHYISRQ